MLTLVLSLALASAAPEAASPPPATSEAKPEKAKKICRANKSTGSRIKGRICKTQEEWDGQTTDIRNDARLNGVGN